MATTRTTARSLKRTPCPEGAQFGRFFLPGPTEVRPEVLEAMVRPVIGHRGGDMKILLAGMDQALREIFQTRRPVYVSTSSATGFMEAAVVNLSRRRILCLVAGAFGERFHKIARRCGRPADVLSVEWSRPNTPEQLRDVLAADPAKYDLVTFVHSETSTGVLNPMEELAAVVQEFEGVLLAVDGVSSVGGVRVPFDEWNLDFLLTGSQKALALPPGLAFAAASERALTRAAEVPARSYYFDLPEFERRAGEFQTTNTPAVSLLYALACQLGRIHEEGLEARWERHAEMARRTWDWTGQASRALGRGFGVLAPAGYRSPTVTAIRLPEGLSGPAIVSELAERGFAIAAGYGSLRDATIRIGHMGDHTPAELEDLLTVLSEVVEEACRE
jgi:aspartate aminotransferase-like enzyme